MNHKAINYQVKATEIQNLLLHEFDKNNYHLLNSYLYAWESDYFHITKTGYTVEIEIKISRSDFRADFKKEKHRIFEHMGGSLLLNPDYENSNKYVLDRKDPHILYKYDNRKRKLLLPNRFYFCTPEGLLKPNEVPKYAGLIEIDKFGNVIKVKEAMFLHKRKDDYTDKLLTKFYWKYINLIKK